MMETTGEFQVGFVKFDLWILNFSPFRALWLMDLGKGEGDQQEQ